VFLYSFFWHWTHTAPQLLNDLGWSAFLRLVAWAHAMILIFEGLLAGMLVAAFVGLNVDAGYGALLGLAWVASVVVGVWGIARLNRMAIRLLHKIDTMRKATACPTQ